jgi:hypothetical protein
VTVLSQRRARLDQSRSLGQVRVCAVLAYTLGESTCLFDIPGELGNSCCAPLDEVEQSERYVVAWHSSVYCPCGGNRRRLALTEKDLQKNTLERWRSNKKISLLAIFLIRETAKSDGVKDTIACINALDGDADGVRRGVSVYFKFRNEACASPQIWDVAPYAFYFCVDGLVTNDYPNVDVMGPIDIVEQSVDSDHRTTLASLGRITEDVEHFRSRKRIARDFIWYL